MFPAANIKIGNLVAGEGTIRKLCAKINEYNLLSFYTDGEHWAGEK